MSDKSDVKTLWPIWLGEDAACSIWTVEYDAALSGWRGEAMPLPDQGLAVMEALAREPKLRDRPLVLIGHSLGGLVIKTALCEALALGAEQHRFRRLADQVRGVAFVATPHSGSELANLGRILRLVLRTNEPVGNMKLHDAHLRTLKRRFDDAYSSYKFGVRTYAERRGVLIGVRIFGLRIGLPLTVVNATSSESHVSGSYAVPLPGDHFSVCKPTDRTAELYLSLIDFLREIRGTGKAPSMPSQIDSILDDTKKTRVGVDRIDSKIDRLPLVIANEVERLAAAQAAALSALAQQLDARLVADRPQPIVVAPLLADVAPSIVRISQAADKVARAGDRRAAILMAEVGRQSQHRDITEVRAAAEADSQLLQQIAGYKIDVGDFRGAVSDLSEALNGAGMRQERKRVRLGLGYALAMEIRRIGTYRLARPYFDMVLDRSGPPTKLAFNVLLHLSSDAGIGRAIMGEMRAAKIEPDIVSWNTLLALARDIPAARAIMGEMRAAKIEPDIVSWSTLLALARDIPAARAIMDEMRAAKIEPNIVSWNTLLALARDIPAARAIMDEMRAAKIEPNEQVATTLARLISSANEAADLTNYLHTFRLVGPGYLGAVVSRLTPLMSAEALLNWVYAMTKELGFLPAPQVFDAAIAGYRREGRTEDALRIVLPFPHLPAAQAMLKDATTQQQAEDWLLNQFQNGAEPFNASLALAYLYWTLGDRGKLDKWAGVALSYPNQHPKRIASIRKLLSNPATG
jgi:hypothetical protein